MKRHFGIMQKMDNISQRYESETDIQKIWGEANNNANFTFLFGLMVHCADLYSPTKAQAVSEKWVDAINEEFRAQYLKEEKYGLPKTPFYAG